jgi:hypothetical protein
MSELSKIDVNRLLADIAIKDGRVMDAVNLAKRGVQLVLEAATRRQQVLEAERRDEIYGTFTITTDIPAVTMYTTTVYGSSTPTEGEGNEKVI